MLKRKKLLLYLVKCLQAQNKKVTKTLLDKLLFIAKKETACASVKFYNFYPYQYGPFSNNFYADLTGLQSEGLLTRCLQLGTAAEKATSGLHPSERQIIDATASRFNNEKEAVAYVYANYPEYTVKSKLSQKHPTERYAPGLFSIGYEGEDIDSFLDCLIQNHIDLVVDVRANPFSMNFAFIKSKLAEKLRKVDIGYLHVPELGIDGKYRKNLDTNQDYAELFDFYRQEVLTNHETEVKKIIELGKTHRAALLCFESDKSRCHRGILSEQVEHISGEPVVHL